MRRPTLYPWEQTFLEDYPTITCICSPIVLICPRCEVWIMLKWAIIFGIVAVIAGFLGFATLAGVAATIAKVLFWLFVAVTVILVIAGIFVAKKIF